MTNSMTTAEAKIQQAIVLLQEALALLAEPVDADVRALARAVQGEGAAAFGSETLDCAAWIAHTAINLFESSWQGGRWASVADVVYDRFHGYANVTDPASWALDIARAALTEADVTGGAQAMLSLADLRSHGWPLRDDLLLRRFVADDGRQLRFYGTWAEEWR